jgi:hypothetical protein
VRAWRSLSALKALVSARLDELGGEGSEATIGRLVGSCSPPASVSQKRQADSLADRVNDPTVTRAGKAANGLAD